MEFGICIPSKIDETGIAAYAENLGYSHAWITDTQMIFSDCWATLALVAQQTRTMKIGTGVAIAPTRLAPVTANAIATINRLAPGRTFLGIGTGNTAMRLMGQPPMKIDEFAEYLRVVRALLDGKRVDYAYRGHTAPIELLMREFGFYALEPRIPMFVSGFGPRAMALAGELGDGLVFSIPRVPSVADALKHAARGRSASRALTRGLPYLRARLRDRAGARRGARLRAHRARVRPGHHGRRALRLRQVDAYRRRSPAVHQADLETLLRVVAGGAARSAPPAPARLPLHVHARG